MTTRIEGYMEVVQDPIIHENFKRIERNQKALAQGTLSTGDQKGRPANLPEETGWIPADGKNRLRDAFPDLFKVYGHTYSDPDIVDGGTLFGIPSLFNTKIKT